MILVFLAFALAYFLSSLIRAITATLSPSLTAEFALSAQDLGLLAGGYFLGFSLTQLPLGRWLDLHGPKKVILAFLSVAVMGCLAFAWAEQFHSLLAARVLCGMGVSACLMAPLTAYRRWFDPNTQLRANSWMLMTGSTGMLAATLPVQWLMPLWGWRPLFIVLAAMVVVTMALVLLLVPHWSPPSQRADTVTLNTTTSDGYRLIWQSPYFWRMVPIGFFCHGGMVAIQTLWAGQWMTQVAGWNATDAAGGLFLINLGMLISFWLWGLITPGLARRGFLPYAPDRGQGHAPEGGQGQNQSAQAQQLPLTRAALAPGLTQGCAQGMARGGFVAGVGAGGCSTVHGLASRVGWGVMSHALPSARQP